MCWFTTSFEPGAQCAETDVDDTDGLEGTGDHRRRSSKLDQLILLSGAEVAHPVHITKQS